MKRIAFILLLLALISGCSSDPVARPIGYMRIGLPDTARVAFTNELCSFSMELNDASNVRYKDSANCWIDIVYPSIMSTIQLTYKPVEENLEDLVRDAQKLAYKHTVKASGMREQFFTYDQRNVHGLYYEMSGASATTTQFYATDSTHHFIRGVLYHYSAPNPDSLAPVTQFMREEMLHMISTLDWNEQE